MKNTKKRTPVIIIALLFGAIVGMQVQKLILEQSGNNATKKLNQVLEYTSKYYIDEVDKDTLVEAGIEGMLEKLDPHTSYIPPRTQEMIEDEFRGNFEGIGVEFQIIADTITVVSPISGGPSEAVGIMAGDRIVEISGKDCVGFTNQQVVKKLRGEKGTTVDVTVYRHGVTDLLEFTIERDEIPLYSVETELMHNKEVGYVSLSRFSETSLSEMKKALKKLSDKGMEKLVLDLRNNPGGLLSQAVKISDLFISGRKKIVYTDGRISEFDEEYYSGEEYPYEEIPLIILVNRGSASASEIVSGAVQDWDRGLIVGETTFGKGLVQRPFVLADNSAIRVTISKYFTPSGRAIQRDYRNKKDYYASIMERHENDGNNFEHQSEKDTTKPVFETEGGRKVYGGGGITPDYIENSDELTDFAAELTRKNIYYQFIRQYMDSNREQIKSKYEDLQSYKKNFSFSDNVLNEFLNFAESKDVSVDEEEFSKDEDYIKVRLKAYIARDLWKNEGWFYILLEEDNQFNKALNLFDEAMRIADLKSDA